MLKCMYAMGCWVVLGFTPLSFAGEYHLAIQETSVNMTGRDRPATMINGSIPGPLLQWREGEDVTINVTNHLKEPTSIHWHGIILPFDMDGVPGVSFAGIAPGETFTYRFTVKQSGTYWYHSHSGFQEQSGVYGPLVIEPRHPRAERVDREYVVMLSDWTDEDPHRVFAKLKKQNDYYNANRRTVFDLFRDASAMGWRAAIDDRLAWGRMRMNPTDIADVTGSTYTYLLNGRPPDRHWTGLFRPGDRVRLRFINGSAMTYFDVRIPGLSMTVVQADGQEIQPVTIDEFRIATAETYDVIVEPGEGEAYTIFAESMDRSGYARGTLALREGLSPQVPARRPPPVRTMADMGMGHGAMKAGDDRPTQMKNMEHGGMAGHEGGMEGMASGGGKEDAKPGMSGMMHGSDRQGSNDSGSDSMATMTSSSRLNDPGIGLDTAERRVLTYADLRSAEPADDQRLPEREIEVRLTGNMNRYIWSFDGEKFSESPTIDFTYGERLRLTLINDTMMEHPIHLHGVFVELDNGSGAHNPRKHTVNVKPSERVSLLVTADAAGPWAFHCHLLYHMESGMFRKVMVNPQGSEAQ